MRIKKGNEVRRDCSKEMLTCMWRVAFESLKRSEGSVMVRFFGFLEKMNHSSLRTTVTVRPRGARAGTSSATTPQRKAPHPLASRTPTEPRTNKRSYPLCPQLLRRVSTPAPAHRASAPSLFSFRRRLALLLALTGLQMELEELELLFRVARCNRLSQALLRPLSAVVVWWYHGGVAW